MDEELKERARNIVTDSEGDYLINDIVALIVAERDSMKEAAAQVAETERNHWGHLNTVRDKIAAAIRSLTPSTAQSREREIRQARLEVGQHMLEVFNRGMTGEGIGKYFDGYVENLAAELFASSQPKGEERYDMETIAHVDPKALAEWEKREQARKEFDAAAIEMANIMYVKCGEQGCKDMLCKRVEVIRAAAVTLGLLPPTCTCDRTGWPGSASPALHEVNCPARKDGRVGEERDAKA